MLTIKDLVEANQDNRKRMNTPDIKDEPIRKVLIFEKALAHKDTLIDIIDCPLAYKDNRGYHALSVGGVITAGYPNVKLFTMHSQPKWTPVIEWCMKNNVRVISMSIATHYSEEREEALKKYVEWGGFVSCASGNWEGHNVSFPADSPHTIGVSATNSEDSNGIEVDITHDSYWKTKQYGRDAFIGFSGTSGAQPVNVPVMLRYQNANPTATQEDYRKWLLINSIKNIDHLHYDHSFGSLERGERYFIYPDNLVDKLVPIEIKITRDKDTILVNGKEQKLRVAPFFKKYSKEYSALCTELRPIFEASGFKVDYDDDTETAIITR